MKSLSPKWMRRHEICEKFAGASRELFGRDAKVTEENCLIYLKEVDSIIFKLYRDPSWCPGSIWDAIARRLFTELKRVHKLGPLSDHLEVPKILEKASRHSLSFHDEWVTDIEGTFKTLLRLEEYRRPLVMKEMLEAIGR
jgi:hypothetical protein